MHLLSLVTTVAALSTGVPADGVPSEAGPAEVSETAPAPVEPAPTESDRPEQPAGDPDEADEEEEVEGAKAAADGPKIPTLPPEGMGKRPVLPHIDPDLIVWRGGVVGRGQAELSLDRKGDELFLFLNLGTVFVGENWRFAPRLPIRFRVPGYSDYSERKVIRTEDWDEVSDWARVIAYYQYGNLGDRILVRFGELNGVSVGHGTVVNRYFNTIDIDHYQGGIYTVLDYDLLGVDALLDNVLDPEILVLRPFGRPLLRFDGLPRWLAEMKVAITMGADFASPTAIARDEEGRLLTDETYRAVPEQSEFMEMYGLDIEFPVFSKPRFDLVPYADLNSIDSLGAGFHLGTFFNFRFSPLHELRTRVEYHWTGRSYDHGYISPFYEIQRIFFRGETTKLSWLRDHKRDPANGYFVELNYRLSGVMHFSMYFADDEGPDNTDLLMRLRLPQLGPVRLSLFFARLGFNDSSDLFDPDATVAGISGRVMFAERYFVKFRLVQEWWLEHGEADPDGQFHGRYTTTTDYSFGVGLRLKF